MKLFLVLALVAAVAVAVPVDPKDAVILRYDSDNIGVDRYNYNVETSDGKSASESGQIENIGTENEALVVRGQFSYTAPDGTQYTVLYTADKDGFKPQGAHIPA
ncbi:unnamed protein product [Arctia plantaginis]|uniref:Uncharacterized protein n=1 Tax=Arctia plantaginis TaxID=874455 RepID=A0A8S0YT31_ARCPL|nr:unnamed protein product [Arctia plantaginis]